MSGGYFDHNQYVITNIKDEIAKVIERNNKPNIDAFGYDDSYYYSDKVIEEFKKCIKLLEKVEIYIHEIDWLLSGDTGDDTFIKRLYKKLDNIAK